MGPTPSTGARIDIPGQQPWRVTHWQDLKGASADFDFVLRLNLRRALLVTPCGRAVHDEAPAGAKPLPVVGTRQGTPWTGYYEGSMASAGVHRAPRTPSEWD